MASAAITADCLRSVGYLAISRSILLSESALSIRGVKRYGRIGKRVPWLLPVPVVDVISGACHVPQAPAEGADLFRIGVLAHFCRHHRADRQIGEFAIRIIDDLVCGFRA